ncbi:hypothetical protein VP1G_11251 [Cytospora mali]|uniref:Uncharacterized protein n=1 Tax=Cytospora mali TaxID=578113 RepID=A0A194VC53_CYTMA|nr:hypothetical protein VP1G_11251 [Valsa mali var. pyri (nom. inval.)]
MQFSLSTLVLALVGSALALPNASPKPVESLETLERRCGSEFDYCSTDADCCSGYACYTKGSVCVE